MLILFSYVIHEISLNDIIMVIIMLCSMVSQDSHILIYVSNIMLGIFSSFYLFNSIDKSDNLF